MKCFPWLRKSQFGIHELNRNISGQHFTAVTFRKLVSVFCMSCSHKGMVLQELWWLQACSGCKVISLATTVSCVLTRFLERGARSETPGLRYSWGLGWNNLWATEVCSSPNAKDISHLRTTDLCFCLNNWTIKWRVVFGRKAQHSRLVLFLAGLWKFVTSPFENRVIALKTRAYSLMCYAK
jgi:hypothetical protein